MNFQRQTVHETVVTARIDDADLKMILAAHVAGHADLDLLDGRVRVTRCHLTSSHPVGAGVSYTAHVEIRVDIPEDGAAYPERTDARLALQGAL